MIRRETNFWSDLSSVILSFIAVCSSIDIGIAIISFEQIVYINSENSWKSIRIGSSLQSMFIMSIGL
jgi:hypothetical protein